MESPYFPVSFRDLPGNIQIEELKELSFYRWEAESACGANQASRGRDGLPRGDECGSHLLCAGSQNPRPGEGPGAIGDLIAGADVLLMDSQYTAEEYPKRWVGVMDAWMTWCGWRARQACGGCIFSHHDPTHDDEFIERMVGHARELASSCDIEIDAAREGEQVVLVSEANT